MNRRFLTHGGRGAPRWVPRPGCRAAMAARSAPARSIILLHHAGRDAAAFTDRQAVLVCPGPDITRTLPAGSGPPGPAGRCPSGLASVLNVWGEPLAERRG